MLSLPLMEIFFGGWTKGSEQSRGLEEVPAILWSLGFVAAVHVLSFVPAIAPFVAAYLVFEASLTWEWSVGVSAALPVLTHLVFVQVF